MSDTPTPPSSSNQTSPAPAAAEAAPDPALSQTRSKLGRTWTIKRYAFIVVLLVLGVWGAADAFWIYPARGQRAADRFEYLFLDALRSARGGVLDTATAGFPEPKEKYKALSEKISQKASMSPTDQAVAQWFEQLSLLGRLKPEYTSYPRKQPGQPEVATPEQRYTQLREVWTTKEGKAKDASPLAVYDLPLQYVFIVMFIPWGLYLLADYLKAVRTVFQWDPAQQRLTLPDGNSLVPADLADVDKRRWDKFYVTLKVKDAHPQLGGKDVELDLMRYDPVEAWVLAMERTAFPEHQASA